MQCLSAMRFMYSHEEGSERVYNFCLQVRHLWEAFQQFWSYAKAHARRSLSVHIC